MAEVSHPTLKAYAERIGAEFVVLSDEDAARHSTPHWAKLKLGDLLNRYDRIIYLDTDILVREDVLIRDGHLLRPRGGEHRAQPGAHDVRGAEAGAAPLTCHARESGHPAGRQPDAAH